MHVEDIGADVGYVRQELPNDDLALGHAPKSIKDADYKLAGVEAVGQVLKHAGQADKILFVSVEPLHIQDPDRDGTLHCFYIVTANASQR